MIRQLLAEAEGTAPAPPLNSALRSHVSVSSESSPQNMQQQSSEPLRDQADSAAADAQLEPVESGNPDESYNPGEINKPGDEYKPDDRNKLSESD